MSDVQSRAPKICKRLMVGSGPDTYDPLCELSAGHGGPCRSVAAIDQHRCSQIDTARARLVQVGQTWHSKRRRGVVRIVGLTDLGGTLMLEVRRNTSRRRQAISLNTLLRDYELEARRKHYEVIWDA